MPTAAEGFATNSPYNLPRLSPLDTPEPGEGYWIYAAQAATLTLWNSTPRYQNGCCDPSCSAEGL